MPFKTIPSSPISILSRRVKSYWRMVPVSPKSITEIPDAKIHPACISRPYPRKGPVQIRRRLPSFTDKKQFRETAMNSIRSFPDWHAYRAYPIEADYLIIGAGVVGSAIAYYISRKLPKTIVVVLERDHTYANCGSVSPGFAGFRTQFTLDENVQLTMSTLELLRDEMPNDLIRNHVPKTGIAFNHQTYLILFDDEKLAGLQEQSVHMQNQIGANVGLIGSTELAKEFPYLNTSDILLGSFGMKHEGWIDPYDLVATLRARASSWGAHFVQADVVGCDKVESVYPTLGSEFSSSLKISNILAVDGNQNLRPIRAGRVIIAGGSESALIASYCGLGTEQDYEQLTHPLPVTPARRDLVVVRVPDSHLPIDCPLIADPSGIVFTRPAGFPQQYIMALEAMPRTALRQVYKETSNETAVEATKPDAEGFVDDLTFIEKLQIVLSRRLNISMDAGIEVVSRRTSPVDINYFDGNWIIGPHPYINDLYFACGSHGCGVQHSLAIGRAMLELQVDRQYRTIDLSRLSFDRIVSSNPLREDLVF